MTLASSHQSTIAALASALGRSPRALIRISGPRAHALSCIARSGRTARVQLGTLNLPTLATAFHAPRSYTGEDVLELILPGNPHLIERVLAAIIAEPDVRLAGPGEFTARAFLNGKLSLDQAEGVAATIAATSAEQLAAAHALRAGATGTRHRALADRIASALALVEAGIDFADQDDVVPITPARLDAELAAAAAEIAELLGPSRARETASARPRVVLVGAANAGKSTLFNALLGIRRAVVSPVAGTTRDALVEPLDLSRDVPGAGVVDLVDLAGLEDEAQGEIAAAAQRATHDAIASSDVILWCDPTGRFAAAPWHAASSAVLRVRTKADLPLAAAGGEVAVCALDGFHLPALRRAIADLAVSSRGAGAMSLVPRHRRALETAATELARAKETFNPAAPTLTDVALTGGALRAALDALEELAGRITPDDVIGRIFATFCVGK